MGRRFVFGGSLIRDTLVRGLLIIVSLGEVLDHLWPLWDGENQSLHDKLAKTFVVKCHAYATRAGPPLWRPYSRLGGGRP